MLGENSVSIIMKNKKYIAVALASIVIFMAAFVLIYCFQGKINREELIVRVNQTAKALKFSDFFIGEENNKDGSNQEKIDRDKRIAEIIEWARTPDEELFGKEEKSINELLSDKTLIPYARKSLRTN